jgi:hypothetical protein
MSARWHFKVGPANRHVGYAQPVTVIADSYAVAEAKAIRFRGFSPHNSATWLISVEELPPSSEEAS